MTTQKTIPLDSVDQIEAYSVIEVKHQDTWQDYSTIRNGEQQFAYNMVCKNPNRYRVRQQIGAHVTYLVGK